MAGIRTENKIYGSRHLLPLNQRTMARITRVRALRHKEIRPHGLCEKAGDGI